MGTWVLPVKVEGGEKVAVVHEARETTPAYARTPGVDGLR